MTARLATFTIADLAARRVRLSPAEAVAIVQALLDAPVDRARPPFGPPAPDNVVIGPDGSVASTACATTLTVLEAAILLQRLLADAQPQASGALRYTVGRALHEVAAPPFESLADFSRALRRFEDGRRADVVAALFARASQMHAAGIAMWPAVGVPFAAAILVGLALIGAGEAMRAHRAGAPVADARPAAGDAAAIAARPIVLNPPLTAAHVPAAGRALSRAPLPPKRTGAAPQAKPPSAPNRSALPSVVLARIRIVFEEL